MAINYTDEFNPYDSDLQAQEPNPADVQPPPAPQQAAPPPAPAPTPNPTQPTDSATAQTILRWIHFGMSPQEAVAKFNRDFGRTTGNEAVFYPASVHGKETIGLPDEYLSSESGGWAITKRMPEGPKQGGGNTGGNLQNDTRAFEDWWSANAPSMDQFTNQARPDHLSQPYTPAVWNEKFTAPTADELLSDPGFAASESAVQRGMERSAAAKGSILSGGFIGRTLPRAMAENAGQAYQNLYGRRLGEYRDRKNDFDIANNVSMAARGINENAFQSDLQNNLNQFNTRYKSYRDTIGDSFDLARLGLGAAQSMRY